MRVIEADHAVVILKTPDIKAIATVYSLTGNILFQQEINSSYTRIPLKPGVYIVSWMLMDGGKKTSCKVIVH